MLIPLAPLWDKLCTFPLHMLIKILTYTVTSKPQVKSISKEFCNLAIDQWILGVHIYFLMLRTCMCMYMYKTSCFFFIGKNNKKNEYSDLTGLVSTDVSTFKCNLIN